MRLAKLLASAAIVSVAIMSGAITTSASAAVRDPEANSNAVTGWHWYHGVSASFVTSQINANSERLVSVRVESTSPLTFTVALVRNSGTYARGWYWYYGLSASQLAAKAASLNARIIDLDRYVSGGNQVFAAILVKNTGAAAKSWWWYYGLTASQVNGKLSANSARLVGVDSYGSGSSRRFAVVMIRNAGVDAASWWWYINATPSYIASKLSANSARLIDINSAGSGRFNVVMVRNTGIASRFWVYGFGNAGQINDLVTENVGRIFDVERYGNRFVAVAIDNASADAARVRTVMRSGWDGGLFGAYLKKVGSRVTTAINHNRIFEPASALKVLPHLYAIQSHEDLDTTSLSYNSCPGSPLPTDSGQCAGQTNAKDICPTNPAASSTYSSSLRTATQRMMQVSDNRETRAVVNHFGRATINTYADQKGIGANTLIRQVFGCGFQNGLRNDWTLVDAGKLYEGVLNGSLLPLSGDQTTFFNLMSTGGSGTGLNNVIQQEANAQGKSGVAGSFKSKVVISSKGGSYDVGCPSGSPSSCKFGYYRSVAGRLTLPYKSGASFIFRSFVFGLFVNDLPIPCNDHPPNQPAACSKLTAADSSFSNTFPELARPAVREALKSW